MRADMHKVIVERPRSPGVDGRHKRRANIPLDNLPTKEGMKENHHGRKHFGEHLGPLRRWLRSQAGRPWNDVYSEACQVIKPDNVVRAHIKTHMLEMVERNTYLKDGQVYCLDYSLPDGKGESPISEHQNYWCRFYVHPESGLLLEKPARKRQRNHGHEKQEALSKVMRKISATECLLKLDGVWYRCDMQSIERFGVPSIVSVGVF